MLHPTVSLGGTHPADLHTQAVAVLRALDALAEAYRDSSPHGRDYPDGTVLFEALRDHAEQALTIARYQRAWRERLEALDKQRHP